MAAQDCTFGFVHVPEGSAGGSVIQVLVHVYENKSISMSARLSLFVAQQKHSCVNFCIC